MKKAIVQWLSFLIVLYAAATLTGCAAVERNRAADAEGVLTAAGFSAGNPPTPEDQADLQRLKPLEMTETVKDGQTIYLYPDPYHCLCVYVGDQKQYEDYLRLVADQKTARKNLFAAPVEQPGLPSDYDWGWTW
jgi:hypothetical protein